MKRSLPLTVVTLYLSVQQFYLSFLSKRKSSALTRKKRFLPPDSPADNTAHWGVCIPDSYLFILNAQRLCVLPLYLS